jgi:hypothetical protein
VSNERPRWRQGFDAIEGTVGPRLTALVNSEPFAVAVGLAARTEHVLRVRSERATRRVLHFWNLPAGSDVTRLLNEVGNLQQQVRELARQLDSARGGRSNGAAHRTERPARPRST